MGVGGCRPPSSGDTDTAASASSLGAGSAEHGLPTDAPAVAPGASTDLSTGLEKQTPRSRFHWLGEAEFYACGGVYMATRLVTNLSQTYIPFYVTDTACNRL